MAHKFHWLSLIIALAALAIVILRPAGIGLEQSTAAKKESVFEHVMRTHTLRCGYAIWNPILFKDMKTGELRGISKDVMDAIGKKLDLKIEWAEETGWGTLVEGLATHRYDMICNGLGLVSARSRAIDFSIPLFYSPSYIAVRKDENRFSRNEDLNNAAYSFAILEGEAASFMVPKKFPKARIESLPQNTDFSLVFQDVEAKKADATVIDLADFKEYEKANPDKLKILDKNLVQIYGVGFGLPQGDVAMKTMIDITLQELFAGGTVDQAINSYAVSPGEFLKPAKPYEIPSP